MISKILKLILGHKLLTGIILVLIIGGGYFGYQRLAGNKNAVRYVTAAVEKGTLIVSVSGSGQVSASNQVDIKPKVSGDVVYVGVKNGQEIKSDTLIVQLDTGDAQDAVRDAEINLETAKASLAQAENDLIKTYEDGFNKVTNVFVDLPTIMSGLKDILFGDDLGSSGSWNLDTFTSYTKPYGAPDTGYENNTCYSSYHAAKNSYEKNFNDYKSASRFSDNATIESLVDETYQTTKIFAEAIKNTHNLVQLYKDKLTDQNLSVNPFVNTSISNLNTYADKINTHLVNLLSIKNTIEANIGEDPLDIQSKKLSVEQKEKALLNAQEKLSDYFIRAPFDGVIAEMNVKKGDSVSSATVLTTVITQQKIAEISLNEVDVAKVKVGQKATLTFDALPGATISGRVVEVDTLGTVAQGVVSYGVKIAFDTDDERIKPGMSVTADIITDTKQDVLVLPNSAIKSQGNSSYVELVEASEEMRQQLLTNTAGIILPKAPQRQVVETGLSNDLSTEIISGLKEGDIVVTSTISPNAVQTTQTQRTQGLIPGMGGR